MTSSRTVALAFEPQGLFLSLSSILPVKQIKTTIRVTQKYQQVLASVREIGVIEPLIVFPQKDESYLLLDGHIRLEVLKQLGQTHVRCLVATDDETYTYNKRLNRM